MRNTSIILTTAFFIALVTFVVYLPALNNGFVAWDDNVYVYENTLLRSINIKLLYWTAEAGLWHPMTMFSLAIDYVLWGLEPFGYHLTNNLIHTINTFLVFVLIMELCRHCSFNKDNLNKKPFISAFIASLLFGIHPLHVESVAWISERKDVLCAFFFLLSLISYTKYAFVKSCKFYIGSLIFFVLALMSKPMAVTLPIVLLILDYYPFKRLTIEDGYKNVRTLLLEKTPFLLFSLMVSVITIWIHAIAGGLSSIEKHSVLVRTLIASHAYVFYIFKMLFPSNLAPIYPLPKGANIFGIGHIGALVILSIITFLAVKMLRKNNLFSAVWIYYLITLLPVIGIVQVGNQAAADRYTYLPSIGAFLLAGVSIGYFFEKHTKWHLRIAVISALFLLVGFLAYKTVNQISIWRNSITLWTYQIKIFPVPVAYNNRGSAYDGNGNYQEAIKDYDQAIALDPKFAKAYNNRGVAYHHLSNLRQAIQDYDQAIVLDTKSADTYNNRGVAYFDLGNYHKAIMDYDQAIALDPKNAKAYSNRGNAYYYLGRYHQAIQDYNRAISLDQKNADMYSNRGIAYRKLADNKQAINDYDRAIALDPGFAKAYNNRGIAYRDIGNHPQAIKDYDMAIALDPNNADAYYNRGLAFAAVGNYSQAIKDYSKAIEINPKDPDAYYNRGIAYKATFAYEQAINDFNTVIKIDPNDAEARYNLKQSLIHY